MSIAPGRGSRIRLPLDRPALGAVAVLLALASIARGEDGNTNPSAAGGSAEPETRVASRSTRPGLPASTANGRTISDLAPARSPVVQLTGDAIVDAKRAIANCKTRFAHVRDYTCMFYKREWLDGRLSSPHSIHMKARNAPHSVYFKFDSPHKGREVIYVAGRNNGNMLAHEAGLFRVIAGTLTLDPRGSRALGESRHPITEAGIGSLIDTVAMHWERELTPEGSVISIHEGLQLGARPVTMIESVHPEKKPTYLFHKVKLYIDHELGLPVRFEAYEWPRARGVEPQLLEEYTFSEIKLNVGLTDIDFDPTNSAYAFGRF